jgi:hypothetical protein
MIDYNTEIKKIFREVEPSEYRDDMFYDIVEEWEKEHGKVDGMELFWFIKKNKRVPESVEELEKWERQRRR